MQVGEIKKLPEDAFLLRLPKTRAHPYKPANHNYQPAQLALELQTFLALYRLTYSYISIYITHMARRATTSDVYNAIAEPQRRHIINLLAKGELSVNDISERLEFNQPQTSKHLKVLKEVDLVSVRKEGKQRFYSLNGDNLKPIHDWVASFAHLWTERFDRLETYLEDLQRKEQDESDS